MEYSGRFFILGMGIKVKGDSVGYRLVGLILILFLVSGCVQGEIEVNPTPLPPATDPAPTATPPPVPTLPPPPTVSEKEDPLHLSYEIVAVYPHDPAAFTQGLLWVDGRLYESTGIGSLTGSSLREVEIRSGRVIRQIDLAAEYFGEGLALVGERLIQLTWRTEIAFVYDRATFEPTGEFAYPGEGWGLCFDGEVLWMSDGSGRLQVRDSQTFAQLSALDVTLRGEPVTRINELECVGESIYANVWKEGFILEIDKKSGVVTGLLDAASLHTEEERARYSSNQVLNGIAFNEEEGLFYLTGKEWDNLFVIRLIRS